MKEVMKMLTIIIAVVSLMIIGGIFVLNAAKQNGVRETEQKQQAVEAEQQEKAQDAKIDIEKIALEKVKNVMKNKYTRD